MSKVYFIGDLHLGHKKVTRFRTQFTNTAEHDEYICDNWQGIIKPRDLVFCMGDVAFDAESLRKIRTLPGRKHLVRGNHDQERLTQYLDVFEDIFGIRQYKQAWLSHCPVHPGELRGRFNIHGHAHSDLWGREYVNVCAEFINYTPVSYEVIYADILNRRGTLKCES